MAVKIMHLSDLHLGNDIVFRALLRGRRWWIHVDDNVKRGLTASIRSLQPSYIVISGDFVNKAKTQTFATTASYLRDIFLAAGFDMKERLLVVPGNHDVSFFPKKHPNNPRRLRRYREFLAELFGESDIEPRLNRLVIDSPERIIFACLDSTLKDSVPGAEGEIGVTQREWVGREFAKLADQLGTGYSRYAKVAVFHHHCFPIKGTPSSSERFMQLLDAADVLATLDEAGINCVLHGHKHVPHVTPRMRTDSSVMTIVGAGTGTCPFTEEQHTWGNNFYLITVSPEISELTTQMYKANSNGDFLPLEEPKPLPLFRVNPLGFAARALKKAITVEKDGTRKVTIVRGGLRVQIPDKTVYSVPVRIVSDVANSKIVDFECHDRSIKAEFRVKGDMVIEGNLVLPRPMTYRSPEFSLTYSYRVIGGTAMSKADLGKLYADGRNKESTVAIVTHDTEVLEMELNLPQGFRSSADVELEHMGAKIPIKNYQHSFNQDNALNRWNLSLYNPPLEHRIILAWTVPDVWP